MSRARFVAAAALFALASQAACRRSTADHRTAGVGDRLRPFISVDSVSGERYCQVCAFGGRPTLMAVFDLDDPTAQRDLQTIQAIVDDNPRLTAFALFGHFEADRLTAPRDPDAARARLASDVRSLGLTFPVTTLPGALTPGEALHYRPFNDRFDLTASRTVLLAAADNEVRFAGRLSATGVDARLKRAAKALF